MKILLTGGSGYLGSEIMRRAPSNWEIVATYLTQPFSSTSARSVSLDIRDPNSVDRVLSDSCPSIVIHTAARPAGPDMTAINGDGSRNVARAAARCGARLIHLSSDVIFDGEHPPYTENDPPSPITPYAESKARAERAVKEEHPNPLVVRTSLIYGFLPMDPRTRLVFDGGMPSLFTDEFRCPVFVRDLADAIIELASRDLNGYLNVAGSQRVSRYDFGIKLAAAFRVQPRFSPALSADSATTRPRDCTLDVTRATHLLHTPLRGVDDVLAAVPVLNL